MSSRLAELTARRAALLAQSAALRGQCAVHARALGGPAAALEGARGLLARLGRVPLRLVVRLAREGLGEALSTRERRATLVAGVAALVRRWRTRRAHRAARDRADKR